MSKIGTITINKLRPAIKKQLYILFFLLFIGISFLYKKQKVDFDKCGLPPTESTFVKEDMEEVKKDLDKKRWLVNLHKCAPQTNWKSVEAQTASTKYSKLIDEGKLNDNKSSGVVTIADGKLIGQWAERGSNNQAGSITYTAYDHYEKKLYASSAGGSLWKGDISGLNWEVFNDQLRFDQRFLAVIPQENGPSKILAGLNGVPHIYYNEVWQRVGGFDNASQLNTKDLTILNNGEEIFFLGQRNATDLVSLYYSNDFGNSFVNLRNFSTTHLNQIAITGRSTDNVLHIIERSSNLKSKLYRWEPISSKLDLINSNTNVEFGSLDNVNLQTGSNPNELYLYNRDKELLKTTDGGKNWITKSQLPVEPWEDGIFVSKSNPDRLIIPNVEGYRSHSGGTNWEKINDWIEYYDNVSIKLHADLMHIAEYSENGQDFIVIGSHGGLNISYDNGQNFSNIGLQNLNVSQYYDAKTYPKDPRYLFGGSQDQGLQRTLLLKKVQPTLLKCSAVILVTYNLLMITKVYGVYSLEDLLFTMKIL